jgi:PhnB protein
MTKPLQTVPKGYHTVTPWIIAKGASELVTFIEDVFGGKEKEGSRMPNVDGSIGHVEVQVGDSVIMLFDHKPAWPETPGFLRLYVEDAAAVLKRAEEAGATVITKLTPLFFGETVARIHNSWGNLWWIHQRTEELDPVEQKKRMNDPDDAKNMNYVQESLDQALDASNKILNK